MQNNHATGKVEESLSYKAKAVQGKLKRDTIIEQVGRGRNDIDDLVHEEASVGALSSTEEERAERWESFKEEKVNIIYCQTAEELDKAMKHIQDLSPSSIALDFETSSKNGRFGSTNGALRLIQIGVEDKEAGIEPVQVIIDCLKVNPGGSLRKLLRSSSIEKQIHYMDFEQEWAQIHLGTKINNVYDTCLAFQEIQRKLDGMSEEEAKRALPGWSGRHRNTLAALTHHYMGMDMPKEEQASDWGRPELSADQVIYATMDVAILPPLTEKIKQIAKQTGSEDNIRRRSKWVSRRISERSEAKMRYNPDDSSRALRAVRRARSLDELQSLKELSRQLTIYGQNREEVNQAYRKRQSELQEKSA